jgi:glycine cleavage system regulatory protein
MLKALVMTVIGRDRPGLVDALSAVVAAHGGNWLESRMSRLGGQFAGIARVEVPAQREAELMGALGAGDLAGLDIVVHGDAGGDARGGGEVAVLGVVGHDRPGIVNQISHVLAVQGVNVEELNTWRESAPMSGDILFHATARLRVPESASLARLRADLEHIAEDLMVDLTLGGEG